MLEKDDFMDKRRLFKVSFVFLAGLLSLANKAGEKISLLESLPEEILQQEILTRLFFTEKGSTELFLVNKNFNKNLSPRWLENDLNEYAKEEVWLNLQGVNKDFRYYPDLTHDWYDASFKNEENKREKFRKNFKDIYATYYNEEFTKRFLEYYYINRIFLREKEKKINKGMITIGQNEAISNNCIQKQIVIRKGDNTTSHTIVWSFHSNDVSDLYKLLNEAKSKPDQILCTDDLLKKLAISASEILKEDSGTLVGTKEGYLLIEHKKRNFLIGPKRKTFLHYAAEFGCLPLMQVVFDTYDILDENARTDNDITLLHCACNGGTISIVKFLVEKKLPLNSRAFPGGTLLGYACTKGYFDIVQFLLKKGASITSNALYVACNKGYKKIVQLLLENNANVNSPDRGKKYPLHCAVAKGHVEIVKLLLEKGANTECTTGCDKDAPLHAACKKGYFEIVKLLIEYNANINCKTYFDNSPLHYAAQRGHYNIVQYLLEQNSERDGKNQHGQTPKDRARDNDHQNIVELFEQYENNIGENSVDVDIDNTGNNIVNIDAPAPNESGTQYRAMAETTLLCGAIVGLFYFGDKLYNYLAKKRHMST